MEPVPRHALQRQFRATVGQAHDSASLHDAAEPWTADPIREVRQESLLRGVVELPRVTADQSEGGIRDRESRLRSDRAGEVDDRPGELARLLAELGELGVNLEDLRLEHSPGAPFGLAEIAVLPEVWQRTVTDLTDRGWRLAG